MNNCPPGTSGNKNAGIAGIFKRLGLMQLDGGDLLLLLILLYLYAETEDPEWLFILALTILLAPGQL